MTFQSDKSNFMLCSFLFRYSYVQQYADIRDGEPVGNEIYGSREEKKIIRNSESVF